MGGDTYANKKVNKIQKVKAPKNKEIYNIYPYSTWNIYIPWLSVHSPYHYPLDVRHPLVNNCQLYHHFFMLPSSLFIGLSNAE